MIFSTPRLPYRAHFEIKGCCPYSTPYGLPGGFFLLKLNLPQFDKGEKKSNNVQTLKLNAAECLDLEKSISNSRVLDQLTTEEEREGDTMKHLA